ncbi:unnamed protein product, partial [Ectocarpus sp. 8 AP-2014]
AVRLTESQALALAASSDQVCQVTYNITPPRWTDFQGWISPQQKQWCCRKRPYWNRLVQSLLKTHRLLRAHPLRPSSDNRSVQAVWHPRSPAVYVFTLTAVYRCTNFCRNRSIRNPPPCNNKATVIVTVSQRWRAQQPNGRYP